MNRRSQQQSIRKKCFLSEIPRLDFSEIDVTHHSICSRFDKVVNCFPQNVALKSPCSTITYSALDSQTNGIAQLLLRLGQKRAERIGLLFDHCIPVVVAQLGVLKAGFTRVDLNVSYPLHRLQQIIDHCKIRIIITRDQHMHLADKLVNENVVLVNVDDPEISLHGMNPHLTLGPDTPASIGYSSGSTGDPKQTVKPHKNELHSTMRVTDSIGMNSQDRMLFTRSTMVFPYHALLHGACYYPTDLQSDGNLHALADWIRSERITVFRSPVSTFRAFTLTLRDTDVFPDLRLILLQGEPVYRADVEAFKERYDDRCVLVSTLGVSECGDFAHYFIDKSTIIETPTVPGGFALKGVKVVLLNRGNYSGDEVGEIGLQGPFLSISNFDSTTLKAEPSVKAEDVATHATGDLGEIAPDGCIFHRGRKDFQVKVRANRVNLEEVEAALLDLEGISQVAVVGRTDTNGDVSLVAYIESNSIDKDLIREKLEAILPSFMVPSLFIGTDELPRTLTGKINRRSLPDPEKLHSTSSNQAEGDTPVSKTIEEILTIWKEVFQVDKIGINESFLDMGGDSLKAMMILARMNQEFSINLTMRSLFDAGTIAQIAEVVDSPVSAPSRSAKTSKPANQ